MSGLIAGGHSISISIYAVGQVRSRASLSSPLFYLELRIGFTSAIIMRTQAALLSAAGPSLDLLLQSVHHVGMEFDSYEKVSVFTEN